MIKRLGICIIMILSFLTADAYATGFFERFSLKLSPGGMFALGGSFNDSQKLSDVVNIGVGLGAGLRFELHNNVYLDFGYKNTWIAVKQEARPFLYKEKQPAFMLPMYYFNWSFYVKSGYPIEPYFSFGGMVCPWKFTQNGLAGKAWRAPGNYEETFSNTSLGLNAGLGVEVSSLPIVNVFFEVKYYYIFSRDVAKLGTDDFNQQDFLGINIGIIFYFKRK